nr:hypothetical protein CFP56_11193 [Quercus suber]
MMKRRNDTPARHVVLDFMAFLSVDFVWRMVLRRSSCLGGRRRINDALRHPLSCWHGIFVFPNRVCAGANLAAIRPLPLCLHMRVHSACSSPHCLLFSDERTFTCSTHFPRWAAISLHASGHAHNAPVQRRPIHPQCKLERLVSPSATTAPPPIVWSVKKRVSAAPPTPRYSHISRSKREIPGKE